MHSVELVVEGHGEVGGGAGGHMGDKGCLALVDCVIHVDTALTDLHVLEARLHATGKECEGERNITVSHGRCWFIVQNESFIKKQQQQYQQGLSSSYCVLCGKSRRCDIVTKGWLSVSIGVILLSASMVSILVNKSMNSLLSAFSASMSLPSRSDVMFTWRHETNIHISNISLMPDGVFKVSADDREKSLPQFIPIERPINTHKASSVRVSVCVSQSPVITLHLSDIINICTGIHSTT